MLANGRWNLIRRLKGLHRHFATQILWLCGIKLDIYKKNGYRSTNQIPLSELRKYYGQSKRPSGQQLKKTPPDTTREDYNLTAIFVRRILVAVNKFVLFSACRKSDIAVPHITPRDKSGILLTRSATRNKLSFIWR